MASLLLQRREVAGGAREQLAPGGRLVIPVGDGEEQELVLIERGKEGAERRVLERVRFVPLLGGTVR